MSDARLPTILTSEDGEGPVYVLAREAAATAEAAIAFAISQGELHDEHRHDLVTQILMRELDPIACKIRGVDEGYWVECTRRAKAPVAFWRIDVS